MALSQQDLTKIKTALQPEFVKLEKKLSQKIERLRKENRKDHNIIIDSFDQNDHKLGKRVDRIESHLNLPLAQ